MTLHAWLATAAFVLWSTTAAAQQLLDRVVALVGVVPITLSDVRAAIGLRLLDERSMLVPAEEARTAGRAAPDGTVAPEQSAEVVQGLIHRQLALREVTRFSPPEPVAAAVDIEVARMRAHAGPGLERLMRDTGLDEQRIRELARETLRIQAYIDQRFGTSVQVSEDDLRRYYETHLDEFRRDGTQIPFEEAELAVRQRVSDERLRASVAQWLTDLRARTEVIINSGGN